MAAKAPAAKETKKAKNATPHATSQRRHGST
jgi:hypothetical protein